MTKVVETNVPHPMLFQKYRKRLRKICRFDPFAHGVYIHIVAVFLTIAFFAKFTVLRLLLLQFHEQRFKWRNQRKAPVGRLGFGPVFRNLRKLAVDPRLCYSMADGDDFAVKIDGVPC